MVRLAAVLADSTRERGLSRLGVRSELHVFVVHRQPRRHSGRAHQQRQASQAPTAILAISATRKFSISAVLVQQSLRVAQGAGVPEPGPPLIGLALPLLLWARRRNSLSQN